MKDAIEKFAMSMSCTLVMVTPEALEQLFQDPLLISEFLFGAPASQEASRHDIAAQQVASISAQRFDGDEYSPDVAWHALNFLLTGSDWDGDWPLCFFVNGGTAVGSIDVGYGPAIAFSPKEVSEISSSLASLTGETISSRFSPKALADAQIYPTMWSDESAEQSRSWLAGEFQNTKSFMERAVRLGCGVIRHIG